MILNEKRVIWMYLKENGIRSMFPRKNIKTRCIIKKDNEILATGETICGLNDNFCRETGRRISMARALKELFPTQKDKRKEFWEKYRTLGKWPKWKLNSKKIAKELVENAISTFNV